MTNLKTALTIIRDYGFTGEFPMLEPWDRDSGDTGATQGVRPIKGHPGQHLVIVSSLSPQDPGQSWLRIRALSINRDMSFIPVAKCREGHELTLFALYGPNGGFGGGWLCFILTDEAAT